MTWCPGGNASAEQRLLQDFGFHLTLFHDDHLAELASYVNELGVSSFKVYMNSRNPLGRKMRMDALPGQVANETGPVDFDNAFFLRVFKALQTQPQTRLNVHCEDSDIIHAETERVSRSAEGLSAWCEARPAIAEAVAIHIAATLSREYGVPLYVPHLGNRKALRGTRRGTLIGDQHPCRDLSPLSDADRGGR